MIHQPNFNPDSPTKTGEFYPEGKPKARMMRRNMILVEILDGTNDHGIESTSVIVKISSLSLLAQAYSKLGGHRRAWQI